MNFYIQQSIQINFIKIGGISNSSVFQIGSAGVIKPSSNLYNTGGFKAPAPEVVKPGAGIVQKSPSETETPKPANGSSPQSKLLKAPAVPFKARFQEY